jgi:hypothetical protein
MFDVARKAGDGGTTLAPRPRGQAEGVNGNRRCGPQREWKMMGAL